MLAREKIELALIPTLAVGVGLVGRWLPMRLSLGALLVIGCLAWLVQGGLRDLWLLLLMKTGREPSPSRKVACLCLESSAGLTGIIIGLTLALAGVGGDIKLDAPRWALLTVGVLSIGFLAKDFVVTWRPFGVRREPEHHTFIFTWR